MGLAIIAKRMSTTSESSALVELHHGLVMFCETYDSHYGGQSRTNGTPLQTLFGTTTKMIPPDDVTIHESANEAAYVFATNPTSKNGCVKFFCMAPDMYDMAMPTACATWP